MCGIIGINYTSGICDPARVATMRDRLSHRGPDDVGLRVWPRYGVALAHRRLSIIDLSSLGRQPMANENQTVWVIFNGEIYNFQELRKDLESLGHVFNTNTDTEVIVHAYEEWGDESVQHLRGMFAYAVWDVRKRKLLLARDRLGIKPLYYYCDSSRFIFSSEPKAILADPAVKRALNWDALIDYLTYGYVPWDKSIFQDMHKLPPAHILSYQDGQISIRQYWDVEPEWTLTTPQGAAGCLRETVADAVRSHMVSDVPVGAFLSGGIDSSIVTAWMSHFGHQPVRTLTIGFDNGTSEIDYARVVAEAYQTQHHERRVTLQGAESLVGRLSWIYDEPFFDISAIPMFYLCQVGREKVKVAISGDGGDELFAGYRWYTRSLQLSRRAIPGRNILGGLIHRLRGLPMLARSAVLLRHFAVDDVIRHFHLIGFFDRWEQERLLGTVGRKVLEEKDNLWLFRKFYRPELPLLTALQLLDLKTYLVDDILVKVDRASMAHSLEVRPPLLDHKVVERAFQIPPELHFRNGEKKWILKESMADMLPNPILSRGKRGFSPPTTSWFKAGLWNSVQDRLLKGRCVRDGILNPQFMDWMVKNYTYNRWAKVWALLMLEEWYRRWILDE